MEESLNDNLNQQNPDNEEEIPALRNVEDEVVEEHELCFLSVSVGEGHSSVDEGMLYVAMEFEIDGTQDLQVHSALEEINGESIPNCSFPNLRGEKYDLVKDVGEKTINSLPLSAIPEFVPSVSSNTEQIAPFSPLDNYSKIWIGILSMLNKRVETEIYLVSGKQEIATSTIAAFSKDHEIKVKDILRMNNLLFDQIITKQINSKYFTILLAVPRHNFEEQSSIPSTSPPLEHDTNAFGWFQSSLRQKNKVGVIQSNSTESDVALTMMVFPVTDYSVELLTRVDPQLSALSKTTYLIILILG